MKRRNILLTVLSVITAICAAMFLTACFSSGTKEDGPTTNAADIVYVSEKDAVITKVNGRDYVKAQDGIAAVGVAYLNGYTGPVLVGYDAVSVQYTYKYSGKTYTVDTYFTVDYNGTTYYYSENLGFMSGDHRSSSSIYTCTSTELEAAALEILAKTEAEKFKLEYNEISTAAQLKAIAGSSERFKLTTDINLINEDNWVPIENFSGTLFGNGQTIRNLTIKDSAEENVGLFGTLQGTVTDLTVYGAQITTSGNNGKAGIIAGTNKGTISNVTVDMNSEITANYYDNVGGIVGYNDCGTILNCKNEGNVTGANNVGGIAGYVRVNANEKIKGCINDGPINGSDSVGGIAGKVGAVEIKGENTYTISNNENSGTVTGKNKVGGVFGEVCGYYGSSSKYGYFEISSLKNNINAFITGSTSGQYAGGLIGYAENLNKLTASENTANVTGGDYVGGFVGKASGTDIQANDFENEATITGKGYVGGFAGVAGVIEYATNNGTIISNGTKEESDGSNACVGGIAGWCRGVVNCKNESNIEVTTGGQYVGGLAGFVCIWEHEEVVVKDSVNSGTVTATRSDYVGGIAGYVTAVKGEKGSLTYTVSDNQNKGSVTGRNRVGGVFGEVHGNKEYSNQNSSFEISSLTNEAEVIGSTTGEYAGGLIGYAERLIKLTTSANGGNTGNVTGGDYVGGLVGYSFGNGDYTGTYIKANGFTNNATIIGNAYVGGIAGQAGIIENAINRGEINSNKIIVDEKIDDVKNVNCAFAGGIAGYCNGVIECENYSNITVSTGGNFVGGLAGCVRVYDSGNIKDSVNNGVVTATESDGVGGIAGRIRPIRLGTYTYTVSDNQNKGAITGKNMVGGVFGKVVGVYNNSSSYAYFEMSALTNNAEINGSTTGEYTGGVIGYAIQLTQLTSSKNTADVTGGDYVGGLAGYAAGHVFSSNKNGTNIKMSAGVENTNTITGNAYVGGIAGFAGIIENAINRGEINSNATKVESSVNCAYAGGIAGYCYGVVECKNYSNITVTTGGKYVGGIAGYVYMRSENVKNNKNEGTITATDSDCVGGVVGAVVPRECSKTYILSYNDNIGGVTGANNVGGIFGEVRGYFSNNSSYCYFQVMNCTNTSSQIIGTSNVGGIVGYMARAKNDTDVVSNSQNSNTDSFGKKFGNIS